MIPYKMPFDKGYQDYLRKIDNSAMFAGEDYDAYHRGRQAAALDPDGCTVKRCPTRHSADKGNTKGSKKAAENVIPIRRISSPQSPFTGGDNAA